MRICEYKKLVLSCKRAPVTAPEQPCCDGSELAERNILQESSSLTSDALRASMFSRKLCSGEVNPQEFFPRHREVAGEDNGRSAEMTKDPKQMLQQEGAKARADGSSRPCPALRGGVRPKLGPAPPAAANGARLGRRRSVNELPALFRRRSLAAKKLRAETKGTGGEPLLGEEEAARLDVGRRRGSVACAADRAFRGAILGVRAAARFRLLSPPQCPSRPSVYPSPGGHRNTPRTQTRVTNVMRLSTARGQEE